MIFTKMLRILTILIFFQIYSINNSLAVANNFNDWLNDFKLKAISSGISENVVDDVMSNAIFLPKVIEYDRFQPEFYEDTYTYIKKGLVIKKLDKV